MIKKSNLAKFNVGQVVHHKLFDYRGVIYDVNPSFEGTDDWYDEMAKTKPPKDDPWYHILVDGSDSMTYVAEQNIEPDLMEQPIENPLTEVLFDHYIDGIYKSKDHLH